MNYHEEPGDLFAVPSDYILAHCISADCAMGKGIALDFRRKYGSIQAFCRSQDPQVGQAILFKHRKHDVFNLITKRVYHGLPTSDTVRSALVDMKISMLALAYGKVAMPKIASGLDRMSWPAVREIINEVFADTDIKVLIKTGV